MRIILVISNKEKKAYSSYLIMTCYMLRDSIMSCSMQSSTFYLHVTRAEYLALINNDSPTCLACASD